MLKILKLVFFLCFSTGLFAQVEYEIIPLVPEGQELISLECFDCPFQWGESNHCLNEAGYAWKPNSNGEISPFIYHKDLGFKIIPISFDSYAQSCITSVNSQGIAVGILSKTNNYWEPPCERIFVYETHSDKYFDLLNHFNSNEMSDYSIENSKIINLTITDSNKIIFTRNSDFRTYIYDLNNQTMSIFTYGYCYSVNPKGQMIGGNHPNPEESSESWFFDSNAFQPLGSLDKFNRWAVEPRAHSQNGFVVGTGLDSYAENKVFLWHSTFGLKEINALKRKEFTIAAINNSGQVIGYTYDGLEHAFILCPNLGLRFLEPLKGGEESYPTAINNHGQVVGNSLGGLHKAFIWDAKNGVRDLNKLIAPDTGWKELSKAKSINDSGYIIGTGNYYGVEQYFLLIPKRSSF